MLVFVVLWYIIDSLMAVGKVFFAPDGMEYRPCLLDLDGCGRGRPEREMDSTYRYIITSGRSMLTAIDRIKTCPVWRRWCGADVHTQEEPVCMLP